MKYSLTINQIAIVNNQLNIDLIDACIIDWMLSFIHFEFVQKMSFKGQIFYWFSHQKIIEDLPILRLKKDSVYRRLKKLEQNGFLLQYPNNIGLGRSFYALTELVASLSFSNSCSKNDLGFKSDLTDENPSHLGSSSELPSDINPSYYNINDYNINIRENAPFFFPKKPDKKDVQEIFLENGGTEEMANIFWARRESEGWKNGKNNIVDFRPLVLPFIQNFRANERKNFKPLEQCGILPTKKL